LLPVASFFQLRGLQRSCEMKISQSLTLDNAVNVYQAAKNMGRLLDGAASTACCWGGGGVRSAALLRNRPWDPGPTVLLRTRLLSHRLYS
ncbi:ankyrin repeat and BTB/POZ domain-containing protein 2-like isoform X1, partial [Lates japonicus]